VQAASHKYSEFWDRQVSLEVSPVEGINQVGGINQGLTRIKKVGEPLLLKTGLSTLTFDSSSFELNSKSLEYIGSRLM
jgi:hypothetical protein